MRVLKYLMIGLAALVAVAVIAVVVVLETTDFNRYRPLIAAEVRSLTGRDLAIAGDFHLALSLTPTVTVSDVKFANAPWGSRPDMARLDRLEAEFKLLPLLSGVFAVRRVRLVGGDILLETDKAGLGNWLFRRGDPAAPATAGTGRGDAPPAVEGVAIEGSVVTFRDGRTGVSQQMKIATLTTTMPGPAAPMRIDLAGAANGAPFTLAGTLGSPAALFGEQPYPVDLRIMTGGAVVTLAGRIKDPGHAQGLAVDIVAEGKSLAELSPLAGIPLPALGPYRIAGALSDVGDAFRIDRLIGRLGGSDFAGDLQIAFNGDRPALLANLTADRFDTRDLGIAPGRAGTAVADGRLIPADPLPFETLRLADATIRFTAKQVIRAPVVLDNVAFEARLEAGKLTIGRFSSGLADGIVTATGAVDASQATPTVELRADARRAEAGAIAETLGITRVLSGGRVTLGVAVSGQGGTLRAILAGLDGRATLEMGPGSVDDAFARLLFADLYRLLSSGGSGAAGTNLDCVAADLAIRGGVATSRGLVIDTPTATIIGAGTIRLDSEALDIVLTPRAKQAGLATLAVPVRIGGSLARPSVYPDPLATLANLPDKTLDAATGIALVPINIFQSLAGMTRTSALTIDAAGSNPCSAALAAGTRPQAPVNSIGATIIDAPIDAAKKVGKALWGILP